MNDSRNKEKHAWYNLKPNKIKLLPSFIEINQITTSNCSKCSSPIISESYQHGKCGSRYCNTCYIKMEPKYYCEVCKIDDPDNVVHSKKDIFVDKALLKSLKDCIISCPDCSMDVKLMNIENHVRGCTNRYNHCKICTTLIESEENRNNTGILNQKNYQFCSICGKECSDISHHKNNCLISWENTCPYNCLEKTITKGHQQESYLDHLDMAWNVLVLNGLTECKKENSSKFKEIMKKIIEDLRESFKLNINEIAKLLEAIKDLKESIKKENSSFESVQKSITQEFSETIFTNFDGTILWRIDNFHELQTKAKDIDKRSIFSPPFYTSRFGYKMCLRLYPSGDSTVRDVAIGLFFVLMKGNYDSLLRWPFKQNITFTLLDQDFVSNHTISFMPKEGSNSFSRPTTDMNIPAGASRFISMEEFRKCKYLKDDSVFIRCVVDCSDLHE